MFVMECYLALMLIVLIFLWENIYFKVILKDFTKNPLCFTLSFTNFLLKQKCNGHFYTILL